MQVMDMQKYIGSVFLKLDDVKDGPIQQLIVGIEEGRFDKPNLIFQDGSKLSLNKTNSRALSKAYGTEGDNWLNKEIELTAGEIDVGGKLKEVIVVKPISPTIKKKNPPPSGNPGDDKLNDQIKF